MYKNRLIATESPQMQPNYAPSKSGGIRGAVVRTHIVLTATITTTTNNTLAVGVVYTDVILRIHFV